MSIEKIDKFEAGKSYSGVLLTFHDGEQHRMTATLRFDRDSGVEFEVSDGAHGSFLGMASSSHPSLWFRGEDQIPEQCIFESLNGNITLTKIRNVFRSQNGRVTGARFVADQAVLCSTRGAINEPAKFEEFISRMDGLAEWWGERNVVVTHHRNENGLARRIEITTREDVESIEWAQNGAQMRVELSWRSSTADGNRSWTLEQLTNLVSVFPYARPADAHLDEHWKIKSLLALVFGMAVSYRDHAVVSRDAYFEEIPRPRGEERERYFPQRTFITRRTVRDFTAPQRTQPDFNDAIFWLRDIGAAGLQRWGEAWDAKWERLIAPTVSVLSRQQPFIEDVILATGIFLDAWGKNATKAEGERATYSDTARPTPTFATYVYRALTLCNADWSGIAKSGAGLANAVRSVYTAVKHAEKIQPDTAQMWLISEVMLLAVRMVAARKIDVEGSLVTKFGNDWAMKKKLQGFENLGLIVSDVGDFIERTGEQLSTPVAGELEGTA